VVGDLETAGSTPRRAVLAGQDNVVHDADYVLAGATSKSKKKKNKKKGGSQGVDKVDEGAQANGNHDKTEAEQDEDADEEDENTVRTLNCATERHGKLIHQLQKPAAAQTIDRDADDVEDDEQPLSPTIASTNGTHQHSIASAVALGFSRSRSPHMSPSPPSDTETTARLDAIAKERDALRQEVTELRKSLESIQSQHAGQATDGAQSKHEEEVQSLREELEEANEGKEHFETQYKNLLGRVNTIKTSLGNRMKADAVRTSSDETVRQRILLTHARPGSRSTKLKSRNCKIRIANFRRTTAVLMRSWRNCDRTMRPKRQRSITCAADRIFRSKTG
jgi:hypothetical protein